MRCLEEELRRVVAESRGRPSRATSCRHLERGVGLPAIETSTTLRSRNRPAIRCSRIHDVDEKWPRPRPGSHVPSSVPDARSWASRAPWRPCKPEQAPIWSPTQGVYPIATRGDLSSALRPDNVLVVSRMGPAATAQRRRERLLDAALLSAGVGKPVRVQLTRKTDGGRTTARLRHRRAGRLDAKAARRLERNVVADPRRTPGMSNPVTHHGSCRL